MVRDLFFNKRYYTLVGRLCSVCMISIEREYLFPKKTYCIPMSYRRELIAWSLWFRHFSLFPGSDKEGFKMAVN